MIYDSTPQEKYSKTLFTVVPGQAFKFDLGLVTIVLQKLKPQANRAGFHEIIEKLRTCGNYEHLHLVDLSKRKTGQVINEKATILMLFLFFI